MTPPRADILLPVETSSRELDAKLLLALFAAEAGFRCHLGPMSRIQAPGFLPSIYISKSVRFAKPVKLMADLGHTIVAWDEEGLARFPDEVHGARIEPAAFAVPSLLFAWGRSNADIWRAHPFYAGQPIVESGNPRIDLLRSELRPLHHAKVLELRGRFGDFVLLNTNFAMVNHFKPGGRRAKTGRDSHNVQAFLDFRRGAEDHKRKLFRAMLEAVPVIAAKLHPFHLIVRPHPSEDPAPWKMAAKDLANASVLLEGSVVPWQLAARCLIHNGCTSAVEASVLQLPALAYRPLTDAAYDIALPNGLSENFADIDALCVRAREIMTKKAAGLAAPYSPLLHDNVAALDGPFACERIVEALRGLRVEPSNLTLGRLRAITRYAVRAAVLAVSPERRRYAEHKSHAGDFSMDDIADRSRQMSEALGRFQSIRFVARSPGIVTVTSQPRQADANASNVSV